MKLVHIHEDIKIHDSIQYLVLILSADQSTDSLITSCLKEQKYQLTPYIRK